MNWLNNQIVLGDQIDILQQMPDDIIDTIITDPPYNFKNNLKISDNQKLKDIKKQERQVRKKTQNNLNGRTAILRKSNEIINNNLNAKIDWKVNFELWRQKSNYINWFIFCNDILLYELITLLNTHNYYKYWKKHIFIMYKKYANNISQYWNFDKEYILYIYKNYNIKNNFQMPIPKDKKDYYEIHQSKLKREGDFHPTPKNIDFCKWLIYNRVPANFNIFDPYAGSGNILKAGQMLNHRVMGVEINAKYQEKANKELKEIKQTFNFKDIIKQTNIEETLKYD